MTFSADQIIWIDFEVRAPQVDLQADGTFRYVAEAATSAIVLAYALGDAPVLTWHGDGEIHDGDRAPDDPRAAYMGGAIFATWNASIHGAVWNYATLGFPL